MLLSFDLDGVVVATDNGLLALLHRAARAELPGAVADLQQYYARRQMMLDPRTLCLPGDSFHIITGRVPSAHEVTKLWVNRWFGWLGVKRLHLVGNQAVEDLFTLGQDDKACELLAQAKLEAIQEVRAAVHFDNNPSIIRRLRQGGVTAISVGGGLL
ncbi:hypothetical protein LCGC14_3093530 [marine sediment metagenome]|uniref:Haloacid dehalogenase-like hydrolase n=1 Tax=marine sediment metagenome TaxID=412755 RepID=A0A0F8WAB6_9ZZZZ